MDEHGERPVKRPRLAAHAEIEERTADKETALEVDVMVLDYLAYQSTTACFDSRDSTNSTPVTLGHNPAMTDAFLAIFKARHATYLFDAELCFRLQLLMLTTLFTQRLTRNPTTPPSPALKQLRATNKARALSWIGSAERMPSAAYDTTLFDDLSSFPGIEELERNRAHVLHKLDIPAEDEAYEDAFYGTSSCVSLLDLLPLFMELSAARNTMSNSSASGQWMRMASEFMLQAGLEQYLVTGAQGSDAVDEAFAWGYEEKAQHAGEGMEVDGQGTHNKRMDEVNDMFEDAAYETEVNGWRQLKEHYLALLFPPSASRSSKDTYSVPSSDDAGEGKHTQSADLVSHLEIAAAKHPIANFEATVIGFLGALLQSLAKPVLTQLEAGELDGMSKGETADFVRSCGLSTARFFDAPAGFKL
ncbi:hypothetical protein LTR36_008797 [Oleoguttula mirabilis]|uniref:Uncharacterized protein n=1 Tax=Oleoguttula mirabilis TaxID=1507867 RepID=A0AAV9J839_9PEZI|nr:hypothetical protein LTR36_008797 [Oleoguttula mirabilis]